MISLGFSVELFGRALHDEYIKKPVCYFEIHRGLFELNDNKLFEYYQNAESRLLIEEGTSERHFSEEDFYIYLIAHEYKHFSSSGTGIRSLMDIYVFWQKFGEQLDNKYLEVEFDKLGIDDFEKRNRSLAFRLFSGEELSEQEDDYVRYFILSGVHGSIDNKI